MLLILHFYALLLWLHDTLGGVAVRGLTATAPIGIGNVDCPSNATSVLQCSGVTPPQSPQCLSNFSAAGVRCIQG